MTILFTHTIAGEPYVLTLPSGGGGSGGITVPVGATAPSITGITPLNQPQKIPAAMTQEGGNNKFIFATFDPIGGTGPYAYEVDPLDPNAYGFVAIGTDQGVFDGVTDRGWVCVPGNPSAPTSKTLKITDATGASATMPVTFSATGGAGIYVAATTTWATNVNPYTLSIPVVLWNGSGIDATTAATVTDTSGYFTFAYGGVTLVAAGNFPPVGYYPMTVSAPGYAHQSIAITIVAAVAGTPYFVQTIPTVSTSVLAGTVVGKIIGTTPNNVFVVSLNDPSNTLGVNGYNIVIKTQPASPAVLSFSFTITDQGAGTTVSCSSSSSASIAIVAGVTLPSSNMSFASLTTAFNNDTWNNAIGAPTVTGITGTKQWVIISQTGYNERAATVNPVSGINPLAARYSIDASSGQISSAILSAGLDGLSSATDTLVLSCSDGVNTCTSSVNITVSWAPISQKIYVSRNSSTSPGGFTWYGSLAAARAAIGSPHRGTVLWQIEADADPEFYTNPAMISYLQGPCIVQGIGTGSRAQPRMGGPSTGLSDAGPPSGTDNAGKAFWDISHGDVMFTNLEVSWVTDAYNDGGDGYAGFFKEAAYGNFIIRNCYIHDCSNGVLTSFMHGTVLVDSSLIENCGTTYNNSGATHNLYIGNVNQLIFSNNVSRRSTSGYTLKTRAKNSTIFNNRILDGLSGSASALIDLPFSGNVTIYNNYLEKGPMALNSDTIRYGDEGIVWDVNTLSVHNNTIAVLALSGAHYGGPCVIGWFGGLNAAGVKPSGTLANNSIYIASGGTKVIGYNGASASDVVETGTTTLSTPASISATRPDLSGGTIYAYNAPIGAYVALTGSVAEPIAGPLYRHLSYGQDSFLNFDGAYHYQDRDQIQITTAVTTGTVICTLHAANQIADKDAGTPNPFVAGTVWALVGDATPYGGFTGWATAKYVLITNSDGSASIQVGHAPLTVGVDYLQIRATAPNGKISDSRYAIAVSAGTGIADNTPATYATLF